MSWVKLDDQFPAHPKVLQAGPKAAWLYVCGLCYAARYLTDGHIPHSALRVLADLEDVPALVERLVAAGLWERTAEGYQIHDFLDYNLSAEQVRGEREAARQRMRKVRSPEVRPNNGRINPEQRANLAQSSASPYPSNNRCISGDGRVVGADERRSRDGGDFSKY